jgi:signal transduction histidine kinase
VTFDERSADTTMLGGGEEMALLDECGVIMSVNAAWRATAASLEPPGSFGVGALYAEACHEMHPDLDAATLRLAVSQLGEHKDGIFAHAYAVAGPLGSRLRQVRICPLQVGGAARLIAIHEDLGEVARANAALRKTTEQLLSAQEVERERIAVELHDSTGQHLTALGLGLARLQRSVGSHHAFQAVLKDMAASLQEAHREIRILSYLLRTPSLLDGGLETTVGRFVKGFGMRTGLRADYKSDGYVDATAPEVQHAALRVIQEALTNVHRHAQATSVDVDLANCNGVLAVRIQDDGMGIESLRNGDLEDVPLGVGIAGMRARVEQLGGRLDIRCDGVGTVVNATIPAPPLSEGVGVFPRVA